MNAVMRNNKLLAVCLILLMLVACVAATRTEPKLATPNTAASNAGEPAGEAVPKISPAEAVKVRAGDVTVRVGESATAEVEVLIADGYHVNANPASFDYLQPTELKIEKADELTIENPVYPPAESKKFSFAEEPIAVYKRIAAIKLKLRANRAAKPGRVVVRGSARSQPCNDIACFPPRTTEFSFLVQIIPHDAPR